VKASNTAGTISVRGINECGKGPERVLSVCTVPAKPLTINGYTSIRPGRTYTYSTPILENVSSYEWTLPSGWTGMSTGNSINVVSGNSGGTISVRAKNSCGASHAKNLYISVSSTSFKTSYLEDAGEDILKIFPNPTIGELVFTFSQPSEFQLTIVNSLGVEILTKNYPESELVNVDLSSLTAGVYSIKIETENQIWYRKVVKQ
jgi:hypothetical protein